MKVLPLAICFILSSILFFSCDKNEFAPEMVDQEFSVEENSPNGTIIGIVEASDRDEDQRLVYEIVDGNDHDVCEIDPGNGAIRVIESSKLDYESAPELILTITVSDEHSKEPLETSAKVKITLLDVNEFAPQVEPQSFTLDENPLSGQEIGSVMAVDPESHQMLTYRIADGTDAGCFHIDSITGLLSVQDTVPFDYELNQNLSIMVIVSDNHANSLSTTAEIGIEITNVIEINHYTISLQPGSESGKDALMGKIVPDTNYGSSENLHLYAWTQSGTLNVNRAALEFDLAAIPAGASIDSARLSLFFNTTSAYGDQHEGETTFIIRRITSGWEESSVTWRTQPSVTQANQVKVDGAIHPAQNFPDIDVAQLVRDMVQNSENSHGFLLSLQDENPYKMVLLASSEHPIEQLRPKLEVHYTVSQ